MAKQQPVYITVCVRNPKALRALMAIVRMSEELADDQQWNDTARKINKAANYLARNTDIDVGQ
jgi:hypothetical protein